MASKFDYHFLSNFVPSAVLSLIKKIAQTPLTSPLYVSTSEDCVEYQFLVNIPDIDPTMISTRRSREEHNGVCMSIISYVTLGTVDIEHHADFHFVGDGFNVVLDPFADQDISHHTLEWFAIPCRELIVVAWSRSIKSAGDVVGHLEFTQTNPENDPWGENAETVALITRFVTHYLTEPGHPADRDQVIRALIGDAGALDESILRPTLFLSVLTGSSLLPVTPTWKVKCLITHDWSEAYPTTDANGRDDYGPDVLISFRSCFKTFTITNNARLRHLLLAESPVQGRDTEVGRFIHAGLLASRASDSEPNPFVVAPGSSHGFELDGTTLQELLAQTDELIQNSYRDPTLSSSPDPYPLTRVSDAHFNPRATPAILHSPQARYPASHSFHSSTSASTGGFRLVPAFQTPATVDTNPFAAPRSPPDISDGTQPGQPLSDGTLLPPRGSLAYIRGRTPAPATTAAIYIGFPSHINPARRGFLESRVAIASATPLLCDLLAAVRGLDSICGEALNDICIRPDCADFRVACSRTMVEVHDPAYAAVANGFREVGGLVEHLRNSSTVRIEAAGHNETSRVAFRHHQIDLAIPFFVLYIFSVNISPATTAPTTSLQPVVAPRHGSRSQTPAVDPSSSSGDVVALPSFLPKLLKATLLLDKHFSNEGAELTALLKRGYKSAYLQIRQALVIERA
ncbi:hypothetical protein C8R46DRAFT_1313688 [Mycena filopes]|nr:hypothetical protein C8R46DRAFT_1313688 [Mycena filopes]